MKGGKDRQFVKGAVAGTVALLFLLSSAGCKAVPKADFTLFVTAADISAGAWFRLTPEPAEGTFCTAANETVASAEDGIVTGLKAGTTVVTESSLTAMRRCNVTVRSDAAAVRATSADAAISVGDTLTISAGVPSDAVTWSSSDTEVLTVADGVVTAAAVGEGAVTAVYGEESRTYAVAVLGEEQDGRRLVWADEFDGDSLDESKWSYQLGVQDEYVNDGFIAHGPVFWGNEELQYYTKDAVSLAEGIMTITAARKEGLERERQFTSARILTRDKGYWTFGYFEARMKLPAFAGMWPAFWLLPQPEKGMGTNNRYGGWAANGEIDIMEAKGRLPYEVGNTLHFHSNPSTFSFRTARLSEPISEWHTYALEWRSDHISWFVDEKETYRLENTQWDTVSPLGQANQSAPFDVPFYIIINLAVGGNYDGGVSPDASLASAAMQVDYVRVYA